ncbi:TolC family protein [uncultured Chitinophaga sp.]|jgi:Outer membrane protein|uniref:TolC family protein n=1 Tax=uncultured Chitinophaga sp. TaxID=339340 RepID=UPI00261A2E54|nr:TolC family protein [uncultured Chitinophaga sp.]
MSTKIIKLLAFILIMLITGAGVTPVAAQNGALEQYIQEAFTNNQSLQQRNFQLDKSMYALDEARGMFLPQVSVMGSYTKSSGGRTIDVPIGDLMNPVYATLNELTGSQKFQSVSNQSFLLNPDNFYDAKVRTTLPLINTEIWYAKQIRQEDITRQQAAVNAYKRQLVKDIKSAYYRYFQAARSVDIYLNALELVQENIRVNESLLKNGVRNSTALTRAKTEQQRTLAAITAARNNQQNARSYFNFLLNRQLTDSIATDSAALTVISEQSPAVNETGDRLLPDISRREELLQLDKTKRIALLQQKQQQSAIIPRVNTYLDLGSQAYNWDFNHNSRYYMWGVNLQWDLFTGGQRRAKARQAASDAAAAAAMYNETAQQLRLELTTARNNFQTARSNYQSAQTQLQLAEKYYTDQVKVYKEGQLLYLELLDAQQQLTNARLEALQAYAQVQIAQAEIERAQATYPLPNQQ